MIFKLRAQFGNRWVVIAEHLPSRSDNAVKNRFYSGLRRLARAQGVSQKDSLKSLENGTLDEALLERVLGQQVAAAAIADECDLVSAGQPVPTARHVQTGAKPRQCHGRPVDGDISQADMQDSLSDTTEVTRAGACAEPSKMFDADSRQGNNGYLAAIVPVAADSKPAAVLHTTRSDFAVALHIDTASIGHESFGTDDTSEPGLASNPDSVEDALWTPTGSDDGILDLPESFRATHRLSLSSAVKPSASAEHQQFLSHLIAAAAAASKCETALALAGHGDSPHIDVKYARLRHNTVHLAQHALSVFGGSHAERDTHDAAPAKRFRSSEQELNSRGNAAPASSTSSQQLAPAIPDYGVVDEVRPPVELSWQQRLNPTHPVQPEDIRGPSSPAPKRPHIAHFHLSSRNPDDETPGSLSPGKPQFLGAELFSMFGEDHVMIRASPVFDVAALGRTGDGMTKASSAWRTSGPFSLRCRIQAPTSPARESSLRDLGSSISWAPPTDRSMAQHLASAPCVPSEQFAASGSLGRRDASGAMFVPVAAPSSSSGVGAAADPSRATETDGTGCCCEGDCSCDFDSSWLALPPLHDHSGFPQGPSPQAPSIPWPMQQVHADGEAGLPAARVGWEDLTSGDATCQALWQ